MKKAEQIANDEAGLLARSDPYQSRVGFTAKQLQEKADARLAKDLEKVHTQGKADRKLAKQLQRATAATEDPYFSMEAEQQSATKPRTRLGKSGKDIAAKQARIEARRQSDAKLQRHMQRLAAPSAASSASISANLPPQSAKTHALAPNKATRFVIASPGNKAAKRPIRPIQDLARALANSTPTQPTRKRGRFDSTLNRGRMLADLLDDIP